jgi:hypothetical protein
MIRKTSPAAVLWLERHVSVLSLMALGLACLWAIYVHMAVRVLPYDDAYITFRYVENTVAGKGPVYNPGQRIFGVSTPLYYGWLVGLKTCLPNFALPTLAVRTNVLWFCLSGIGVFFLVRRCCNIWWGLAAALFLLLSRPIVEISTSGMEPFMLITAQVFALLAASMRRPITFGILTGLAILARPEGVCLVPVGMLAFGNSWRDLVKAALPASLLLLCWIIPAAVLFGTPIPHSVIAKAKLSHLPRFDALREMAGSIGAWFSYRSGPFAGIIPISIQAVGTVLCWTNKELRRRAAYGAGVMFNSLLLMYAFGNPTLFPWYFPEIFATALITIFVAAYACFKALSRHAERDASSWGIAWPKLAVASGLMLVIFRTTYFYVLEPSPLNGVAQDPVLLRCLAYREAAVIVESAGKPGDRVALNEIGAFGYFYKGPILDLVGLVSAEPLLNASSCIQTANPDWIVWMPVHRQENLWVSSHYQEVQRVRLPKPLWDCEEVLIYRRRK